MASRVTMIAHLFGAMATILMLVWLLHYRGGIDLDSDSNSDRIFNVHPFLMFFGFIFIAGEAIMGYRTVAAERKVQKLFHMVMHLIAITLGIIGIYAVFKYHDEIGLSDMYSLHSWIGLGTFCLFGLQWLFGFFSFWLPKSSLATRETMKPWHIFGGRALLYMAICSALTGLMEKATIMGLKRGNESRLINFTGLFILLFGLAVDLSLSLAY
ncbi:Cytochrome b561 [Thalictrum thalictroides]|uniref:Cytochrome b561 n=1 Tax=Thalictrum thalictroides TaxID=46969 RepID=A0A7J6WH21_THATH|nr:Cytochrome b561 [Thalictrum thalictroides]